MKPDEMQRNRESYAYVPAHLKLAAGSRVGLTWGNLALQCEDLGTWPLGDSKRKRSSVGLDNFHETLLNAPTDAELLHGLASVVFWGFASGANGRVNLQRALAHARMLSEGNARVGAQTPAEIVRLLRSARATIDEGDLGAALLECMKLRFIGMSFASKIVMFMNPRVGAVYDRVISRKLHRSDDSRLRSLYVPTALAYGDYGRARQAECYKDWCAFCSENAEAMNNDGRIWRDWDGKAHPWRGVDVERAFFASREPEYAQ